jgi:hypothetical protein
MSTYPRLHSELSGQSSEEVSTTVPDYRDYEAMARLARFVPTIFTATIAENTDHVTVTHNLGYVPSAVVFAPVDNVGRCWYDMNTISTTTIDIWVANPPSGGSYVVRFLLYPIPVYSY